MPKRVVQFRKLRKQSIGDMREVISLEERSLTAPDFASAVASETYDKILDVWAKVETRSGIEMFNGVNTREEGVAIYTHQFTIRYRDDVTSQTRIRYKDNLYKIIDSENLEERSEYLLLRCRIDGDDSQEVNQ